MSRSLIQTANTSTQAVTPADMMAVYNYLHKEQIAAAREVKVLQAIYKEQ